MIIIMEYHTYQSLYDTINRQYPRDKQASGKQTSTTEKQQTDKLYNQLLGFYNNPNFDKIKTAIVPEVKKENKDDIDNYVYIAKNYI